jgi:hypothetical protein
MLEMKPKKPEIIEPKAEISFGPFSEPRTIPGGWDVSAFYTFHPAEPEPPCSANPSGTESVNENTENTL